MIKPVNPLSVELKDDSVLVDNDLRITFQRTIRVPDNNQVSRLPPGLGTFPLKPVARYARKLPPEMAAKGGLFLPMYQSEAMWISFECDRHQSYMIKVYVGGINAISGEPAEEDASTKLRRLAKLAQNIKKDSGNHASSLQDYIIVPGQLWLDGIADSNGTVRQFVAMPFRSGYSVESQVTGKDAAGGIQFEITPYTLPPRPSYHSGPKNPVPSGPYMPGEYTLFVKLPTGKTINIRVFSNNTIDDVKTIIYEKEDTPQDLQRLIHAGRQLEDERTLSEYQVFEAATIHLVFRLRGGAQVPTYEMSVAAGGKIHQTIKADNLGDDWLPGRTTVFNVQILNSAIYKRVIGENPPTKPMDAKFYKKHGFPFFKMYEEPSGVSGNFSMVKSVAQIDKTPEDVVEPRTATIYSVPTGLVNPRGPLRNFRTARNLKDEFNDYHVASF